VYAWEKVSDETIIDIIGATNEMDENICKDAYLRKK